MSTAATPPVSVGTENDPLAIARAQSVVAALVSGTKNMPGRQAELIVIDGSVDELVSSLVSGAVEVMVTSATVPGPPSEIAVVAAFVKRADSRDALCTSESLTFDTLAEGARVVVSSRRRRAQVLARRADLVVDVVGQDVGWLLDAVAAGEAAATVVAVADLDRLRRLDAISEFLGIDGWPTDAGQGAVCVSVLRGAEKSFTALGHNPTRTIVEAEWGVRDGLGDAGAVAGVHGIIDDGLLFLSARVYAPDGSAQVTSSHALYLNDVAHPAAELSARVVAELVSLGARDLANRTV